MKIGDEIIYTGGGFDPDFVLICRIEDFIKHEGQNYFYTTILSFNRSKGDYKVGEKRKFAINDNWKLHTNTNNLVEELLNKLDKINL